MLRLLPATATVRLPKTGTSRTLRKSCDSCVRLKRACNGESPCRLCARMGKCCSRSAKKRSGPPKGTKYQPRRQQPQEALATHQQHNTTSGSGRCSSSEMDPSAACVPHNKVAKLRADDDAGASSFVRRVSISKMGDQQQRLDPAGENPPSSGETPEDDIRGEEREGTRAVATEVDDGALLLLRMLKTFHPSSSRNLGFTNNVEAVSCKVFSCANTCTIPSTNNISHVFLNSSQRNEWSLPVVLFCAIFAQGKQRDTCSKQR